MKGDPEVMLSRPETPGGNTGARAWRLVSALMLALAFWLVAWYGETASSIVSIWERSETFAHGYLVVPVFAWLVWRMRAALARIAPRPAPAGLALIAVLGFGWLVAHAGQVQVVQHFALVAMIPAIVLTVLGTRIAGSLAFPLAFLLLAVPFGEALIPPLMYFTADFTVTMLRATGIPVLREGTFFTIPSGQWSVVEGCSGLRYLIASIFAGTLYAYLTYSSYRKRALFIAASVIVPIFANGMRAYLIVMIAHLSDMRLALGIDHIIYGWVWFGIVIMAMFWIGARWRDPEPDERAAQRLPAAAPALAPVALAAAAAVLAAGVWPAAAAYLDGRRITAEARLEAPAGAGGWMLDAVPVTDWAPQYRGADASMLRSYRKDGRAVQLYVGYYRGQRQDAELINSQNIMIRQKHPVWQNVGESRRAESVGGASLTLRQTLLRSQPQRLLVWDWFYLDGRRMTNAYLAKLLLARDRLLEDRDDASAIILATAYENRPEPAADTLREFIADMLPSIEAAIGKAERR